MHFMFQFPESEFRLPLSVIHQHLLTMSVMPERRSAVLLMISKALALNGGAHLTRNYPDINSLEELTQFEYCRQLEESRDIIKRLRAVLPHYKQLSVDSKVLAGAFRKFRTHRSIFPLSQDEDTTAFDYRELLSLKLISIEDFFRLERLERWLISVPKSGTSHPIDSYLTASLATVKQTIADLNDLINRHQSEFKQVASTVATQGTLETNQLEIISSIITLYEQHPYLGPQ